MNKLRLMLLLVLTVTTTGLRAQTNADEQQITTMLKTFYTAYMSAYTQPDIDHHFEKTLVGLRKKYCTVKCEKQFGQLVEATDGDPIIHGQDSDEKWTKTLIIKKISKTNYNVSYTYDAYGDDKKLHKSTVTIKLAIVKEKESFKIDKILNGNSDL